MNASRLIAIVRANGVDCRYAFWLILICSVFVIAPSAFGLDSNTDQAALSAKSENASPIDPYSPEATTNEKYIGQDHFSCNGFNYKIPSYLPYLKKFDDKDYRYYLTALKTSCLSQSVDIVIGIKDPGCLGENVCVSSTFTILQLSPQVDKMFSLFASSAKFLEVEGSTRPFYYVPASCSAYCSQAYLTWRTDENIFVIGTKSSSEKETLDELIKSAQSLKN